MKKRGADHKVVRSEDFTEGTFGIDKSNLAHIFDILRNSLYSNSIHAVVREYSTNADDAQKEAGSKKQFEVWLPTRMSNEFVIRDYGMGLDVEEVMEVYCMYGTSTKRHSNDYNGMLGLGSKSAFSYAQNFAIASYKGGKKYIFNAYIDESLIGKVALMDTLDTKQEDGIEIRIPVKSSDWYLFQQAAERIYSFFEKKPILHNQDTQYCYDLNRPEAHYSGSDWYIPKKSRYTALAVMGNVAYPIDASHLKDEIAKALVGASIIVEVPVGKLEIAANREDLQYTEITKKALNERFGRIVDELKAEMNKGLQDCKNIWDAVLRYEDIYSFSKLSSQLSSVVAKHLQWRGIDLTSISYKGFQRFSGVEIRNFFEKNYLGHVQQSVVESFRANKSQVLVWNDENEVMLAPKIKLLISEADKQGKQKYPNGAIVLTFKDAAADGSIPAVTAEEAKKNWYDTYHFEGVPMLKMSELPKPEREKKEKTKKVSAYEVVLKQDRYGTDYSSLEEKEIDIETATGIYFEINREKVVHPDWKHTSRHGIETPDYLGVGQLAPCFASLRDTLGITLPTIYAFKTALLKQKKEAKKFSPKLTCAIDWARKQLAKDIKKNDYARILNNDKIVDEIKNAASHLPSLLPFLEKNDGAMWQLAERYNNLWLSKTENKMVEKIYGIKQLANSFKVSFDDVLKESEIDKLYQIYPLLKHTGIGVQRGSNYSYHLRQYIDGDVVNKELAVYIGAIDAARKNSGIAEKTEDNE